jgi:hypothetical protein
MTPILADSPERDLSLPEDYDGPSTMSTWRPGDRDWIAETKAELKRKAEEAANA